VQYQLLKLGIDSARLTTDAGIDLVVYALGNRAAFTVPVKANLAPKAAGGGGPLSRGWFFPHTSPAQLLPLVAFDSDRVWLFTMAEAQQLAQQHSEAGITLYWAIEPGASRVGPRRSESDMDPYCSR
jgi:hypothetical protein